MEQKIQIKQNGQFNNVELKDVDAGNHIIVTKTEFAEGRLHTGQYGDSYSCRVLYEDQPVSFWLKPHQHEKFKAAGELGEAVKITCFLKENSKKKGTFYKDFEIEKVTE